MFGFVSRDDIYIGHAVVETLGATVRIMQTSCIISNRQS